MTDCSTRVGIIIADPQKGERYTERRGSCGLFLAACVDPIFGVSLLLGSFLYSYLARTLLFRSLGVNVPWDSIRAHELTRPMFSLLGIIATLVFGASRFSMFLETVLVIQRRRW